MSISKLRPNRKEKARRSGLSLHHPHDHILHCICRIGRRSIAAASRLRSTGDLEVLSVLDGLRAWTKLKVTDSAAKASPLMLCGGDLRTAGTFGIEKFLTAS